MPKCPFCSAPVDAVAANAAADLMSKVNQGCSDASYLRIMAGLMGVFFVLSLIPFVSWVGSAGYWFMFLAVPFMAVRWWVKFGKIKTGDTGFASAKKSAMAAVGIWLLLAIAGIILSAARTAVTSAS